MLTYRRRMKGKVREQNAVPSFFTSIGEEFIVSDPKEARKAIEANRPCIVLFIPSSFSDAASWASALSSASYLIVAAPESRERREFMKRLDNIIFSPAPRHLAAASAAGTMDEAMEMANGVKGTFPTIITIRAGEKEAVT